MNFVLYGSGHFRQRTAQNTSKMPMPLSRFAPMNQATVKGQNARKLKGNV